MSVAIISLLLARATQFVPTIIIERRSSFDRSFIRCKGNIVGEAEKLVCAKSFFNYRLSQFRTFWLSVNVFVVTCPKRDYKKFKNNLSVGQLSIVKVNIIFPVQARTKCCTRSS